ncbi:hypothetical protein LCGC14_2060730 [marine sediment metagenome]|uniref:Uncharacterized protein n=1 Tax=marine sediment metagenome TaxID=412755 RepID=A0A0F9EL86_9ZZZZ
MLNDLFYQLPEIVKWLIIFGIVLAAEIGFIVALFRVGLITIVQKQ